MPYEVRNPRVIGNYLAGRQAAQQETEGAQLNALRGQQLQRAERLNALSGNPNATPEQYIRAGDVQTGAALTGLQDQAQDSKRQSLARAGAIAQRALSFPDEASRKAFLQSAVPAYAQDFSALGANVQQGLPQMLAMSDQELMAKLQQVAAFGPQSQGESYTLKPGEARFVGGKQVAALPASQDDGGFSLSPGQTRFDAQGRPIASLDGKPTKPELFDVATKLRNEYNTQSKEFTGVADAYQRIKDSASDPSAAGDLSLIFNFMKVLDPGSTVREGEFATAQNAGSIPARVVAQYNKVMSGERLAPEQRADFVSRATKLYKGQEDRFTSRVKKRYEGLSKRYGIDPAEVLSDPTAGMPAQNGPVRVNSPQEAMALPPGTQFVTPDGRMKVRP